ncbi:PREDICTED: cytidine deaminase-like [Nicrophorus vespilloides]|uniref:Cytidine deaminase n=1 Tax=Nicrophorus vespilloides TaxID=110193 RepID=A0ABM1LZV6_NICVS|nr:PREDICTED: cytidine deaminase-like [Nicrophorus vespilloides]
METNGNNNNGTTSSKVMESKKQRSDDPPRIVKFETLDERIQRLLQEAVKARTASYSPYSNFKVGACVECVDGTLYGGCNVENASYPVGICAERCAYVKAISDGRRQMRSVAIVAQQEKHFTTPCGLCRQFMSEFGDAPVFLAKPDLRDVLVTSVSELLPLSFQINEDYSF